MPVLAEHVAQVFVEVADTLVDDFDLIEFLERLTAHTADLVGGASVGLSLADQRGSLQFMAASTDDAKSLELLQLQSQDGPCLDAYMTGKPVVNLQLSAAASKWPSLATRAEEYGYQSVHALPMRLRSEVIGALNIFSRASQQLDDTAVALAQALADVATIALITARSIQRSELLTEQLQTALNSRIVIEQAKGAVAQYGRITPDEAFGVLRGYARSQHRPLSDVARDAVSDPQFLRALF